jgi:protein-disulfide isomerase
MCYYINTIFGSNLEIKSGCIRIHMSTEGKIFAGLGIVTVIIIIAGAFLLGGSPEKNNEPQKPVDKNLLVRSDSNVKGAKTGKVTVVEFGDFQCPACGAAHPVVKQISEEYKEDVTFVFRHFPLSFHKNAIKAALAAEAAGAQGKFFEMHDLIFDNQSEWSESNDAEELFQKYAEELSLDMEKYQADFKNKTGESKINKDRADGNAAGVSSTPTFFINGKIRPGGIPYDEFKTIIEAELQK